MILERKGRELSVVAIIPARMGASRFPGKPLARILGCTMIEHVYRRTAMCSRLAAVYVATCDQEIATAVRDFGGEAIMTSSAHKRASERVTEAARSLAADVVVMVQGDEPMVVPEMIELATAPLLDDPKVVCSNLVKRIESIDEFLDPNTIKVVADRNGNALYFSREPIPTRHSLGFENLQVFKQVCIIPFRRDFLLEYSRLEPTPLEQAESIDMLRLLEHGFNVSLVESNHLSFSVDTLADLAKVESLMRNDPLLKKYR